MALTRCGGVPELTSAGLQIRRVPPVNLLRCPHALADEERRIRARSRPEFLRAAVIDFGEIEIALRIHAHSVHVPQRARPIALTAPGIKIVPVEIEFDDLGRSAVGNPHAAVGGHVEKLRRRGLSRAPLIEELAVFIKDLDAMIRAIGYENAVRWRIEDDSVHIFKHARSHIVRRIRRLAKGHHKFAVFIEFHDARIAIAVCDEHLAVGKPIDEGRPVKVLLVAARLIGRAKRLHQLLAIVREFVNRMALIVNYPNVFVRIVRVNGDVVWALEQGIPFRPRPRCNAPTARPRQASRPTRDCPRR